MKSVAFYLDNLGGGGIEEAAYNLALEFQRRGYVLDVVVNRKMGVLVSKFESVFNIVALDVSRPRSAIFLLGKYLKEKRPNALIANAWPHTGVAVLAAKLFSPKTRILTCDHTNLVKSDLNTKKDKLLLKYFGRYLYAHADVVAAVSQGVAESIQKLTGYPEKKIKILYNPLRVQSPDPILEMDNDLFMWWAGGEKRLLSVGNLKPAKSFDVLIKSIPLVLKSVDTRLIILGEGGSRDELEKLIFSLELSGFVRLAGYRENPFPFYSSADLFVLSSSHEGFPLVLLEAMSCALPVVSTDCNSGPREVLDNGVYGRLVPVNDHDQLAEAILSSLGSKHKPSLLRNRADEFSVSRVVDRYLKILFPN